MGKIQKGQKEKSNQKQRSKIQTILKNLMMSQPLPRKCPLASRRAQPNLIYQTRVRRRKRKKMKKRTKKLKSNPKLPQPRHPTQGQPLDESFPLSESSSSG